MKMSKQLLRINMLIVLISCLILQTNGQERSALIKENVAIFYPKDFSAEKHLPSFCLLEEPKEIGPLPNDWDVKVEFSASENKSLHM